MRVRRLHLRYGKYELRDSLKAATVILDKASFVEGIGMNCYLNVIFIGYAQASIDSPQGLFPSLHEALSPLLPPEFVQLNLRAAKLITLAQKADIHRKSIGSLQHHL